MTGELREIVKVVGTVEFFVSPMLLYGLYIQYIANFSKAFLFAEKIFRGSYSAITHLPFTTPPLEADVHEILKLPNSPILLFSGSEREASCSSRSTEKPI